MRKLKINETIRGLIDWITNFTAKVNLFNIVVGLSGGIDSSVTAALCAKSLGNDNILGLGLPCESSPEDLTDAKMIARHLGIKLITVDLTSTFREFLETTKRLISASKVAVTNFKPRLRMATLYFAAQSKGNCLVAGTGNRAEIAIGYFTKYGDGGVDFEPLGGLYKQEVRKIAKAINLPGRVITKAPSAGLWEGQTDEGEIGMSYDLLDEILYRIDHNLSFEGLEELKVKEVLRMMESSKHKIEPIPYFKISNSLIES